MATTIKRGLTLRAKIQLEEDEWAALWPWTSIAADARRDRTAQAHAMAVSWNEAERAIWLQADTSLWPTGQMQFDVRVVRGGSVVYLPPTTFLAVEVIHPATERSV